MDEVKTMQTHALYYEDGYRSRFTATVLSCEKRENGWAVTLDATAFYPEGGGQDGDTGTLNGIPVLDTQEVEDQVVHYCVSPLTPGETVEGIIDFERRFDLMQQHTGEHIISGIIHQRYGYHNVGFHMGAELVTIDFDGPITAEQLSQVERMPTPPLGIICPSRPFSPARRSWRCCPTAVKKRWIGPFVLCGSPALIPAPAARCICRSRCCFCSLVVFLLLPILWADPTCGS